MVPVSHCPGCKRALPPAAWHNDRQVHCPSCDTDLEFVAFPALTAARFVARPESATLGDDATCFFHTTNRAEAVCAGCGRLLCAVCAVDFAGKCLCPSCIAARPIAAQPDAVKSRLLWDSLALSLATLPILMWPVTLVTAPAAIGLAIYGWNKPGSLVRGSKTRLVVAMVLAGAQVVGWTVGLVTFLL
ncbi:MAG: hypothetical protein IPL39_04715 [Opitutaceae bacterium]|nr:hypothetical protein [Opitutaceae bacterium]